MTTVSVESRMQFLRRRARLHRGNRAYHDIFQRELAGEVISLSDPEYPKILARITEAQRIIAEMNTGYRDPEEVRGLFERLTGVAVDESFWLLPPFYTDYGKNIRVGRNVFINHACEFMDRGGITIEDDALIGPKVNLVTINHPLDPNDRRSTYCAAHPDQEARLAWGSRVSHAWRDDWRECDDRRKRRSDR